ncbi:MAG: TlpA family protein disulfide reductase [Halodesulfovibrio sp.]
MNRRFLYSLLLLFVLLMAGASFRPAMAAQDTPQTENGDASADTAVITPFPNLLLPAVPNADQYGLPPQAVQIGELQEEFIIINVYSWFCAPCQAEGPDLRELSELIGPGGTDGTVRIIGIATGDDATLTKRFRDKHALPYALFPDPSLALHGLMQSPPVPTFYIVRNTMDGPHLLATHTGAIRGKAKALYSEVLKLTEGSED